MASKNKKKIKLLKGEKFMYGMLVALLLAIPMFNVYTSSLLSETNNELEKLKIKDEVFTANGNNKEITNTNLNPSSFNFAEGVFTFATTSDACNNGAAASGTNYQVTYSGEKFNKPEATSPVACY